VPEDVACVVYKPVFEGAVMTISEALALGQRHQESGRLAEAQSIYTQILAAQPGHAEALNLLGVIAHQTGRRDVALDRISRAVQSNGAEPIFHGNLAAIFRSLGLLDDAIRSYPPNPGTQPQLERRPAKSATGD